MTSWLWVTVHDTQVYMGLKAAQYLGIKKATGGGSDPGNQYDFGGKTGKKTSAETQAKVVSWTQTWVLTISHAWISSWP